MAQKGLSKERVVQAAKELIEEKGIARFSMAELARRLQIQTASLYNHVESLDSLLAAVGEEAVAQLVRLEEQAIAGRRQDEALFALAEAYRAYACEHNQLYRVILSFPRWGNPTLDAEARRVVAPFLEVLSGYGLTDTQQHHWQRVLRAVMTGFAFHEQAGGFSGFPEGQDESFSIAIRCVADGLRKAGGNVQ